MHMPYLHMFYDTYAHTLYIYIYMYYIYIECIYIFSTVVCVYTLLFSIFLREGLVQVQLVMPVQLLL